MKKVGDLYRLERPRLLSDGDCGLLPQYPSLPGLPPALHRRMVEHLMNHLMDALPALSIQEQRVAQALRDLHLPHAPEQVAQARAVLSEEELRIMMTDLWHLRQKTRSRSRPPRTRLALEQAMDRVHSLWPWPPRSGQTEALKDIWEDLRGEKPMLRVLTGDVGSGKTAVALAALDWVIQEGFQGILLAPTALLARQHFEVAERLLPPGTRIRLVLGGAQGRNDLLSGERYDLLVGTHALLSRPLVLSRPGLLVVDEQHRFGVSQRQALLTHMEAADLLMLSATPIPRTLLMHLYGDLPRTEMAVPRENMRRIQTRVLGHEGRETFYRWLGERIREKNLQGFVVFPRIDSDPGIPSLMGDGPTVGKLLGVAHALICGRDSEEEIQQRVGAFRRGEIRVLLATTVIEVGLDVPQASFMVVEGAERLGLAQLHQLRGRVGRKGQNALCCLLAGPEAGETQLRHLQNLVDFRDGFELSRRDLLRRGGGDIAGIRQSGSLHFRFVHFPEDLELLERLRPGIPGEEVAEIFRPWLEREDPELEELN